MAIRRAQEPESDENKEPALQGVTLELHVILGDTTLRLKDLLKLGRGAVIEFDQATSDPVRIYAGPLQIGEGEVVVTAGEKIGVTLTKILRSTHSTAK